MKDAKPPLPQVVPVTTWPPAVRQALLELVAFTYNEGSAQMMFSLTNLVSEGRALGEYEVTIRKIE